MFEKNERAHSERGDKDDEGSGPFLQAFICRRKIFRCLTYDACCVVRGHWFTRSQDCMVTVLQALRTALLEHSGNNEIYKIDLE